MYNNNLIKEVHTKFHAPNLTMIDIGSRWGLQRPWDQYPNIYLDYIGFDADTDECLRLNTINKDNNIKYIPAALSNKDNYELFYITKETGRSSFYIPNFNIINEYYEKEGFEIIERRKLKTTSLNKVLNKENIEPDFLKLDVQGAELNIIKGADNFHNRILGFEIEVEFIEIYQNQPLFSEINSYMISKGFLLYDLNRYWVKRNDIGLENSCRGQIAFADAVYFKNPKVFYTQDYSSALDLCNQLIKTVNIFIIYGYFDNAIYLLQNESNPLDPKLNEWLIGVIDSYSKYNRYYYYLSNNTFVNKIGVLLSCIGEKLMLYTSSKNGWGTDYNSYNGRYGYHKSAKIVKLFGRK